MIPLKRIGLLCALAPIVFGCSGGGDDGVKPENAQALTDASSIAKKVDGNYDKMSDSEKQLFLKMANNNVDQARNVARMMAHPPNELYSHKAVGADRSRR